MSANQSNLSDPHYGYDFVVATTQESINATMKEHLYNTTFPVIKMYWNQDDNGNPVPVSYDDLMKQTNGTDPLTVPSWNQGDPMTAAITNISNSNFYFAFEAALGIPLNMAPADIPDIITLQGASQSVIFNLMCSQFTVVTCNFGRHGLTSFFSATQPNDTPWLFTSTVPLKNILNNKNLPPNVQSQLDNLGPDAFSVQQLFYDLDNAALESTPTISGLPAGTPAYTLLEQVFLGAYFTAMKSNAAPILNYSIVQNQGAPAPPTLTLTSMAIEVSPYTDPITGKQDKPNLNTLNYLCATNNDALPPSVPFGWNWVEAEDESSFNGVVSIKRSDFLNFLNNTFSADLGALNIVTNVSMRHSGEKMYSTWSFYNAGGAGQAFTVLPIGTTPVGGYTPVLSYSLSNNSSDSTHDAAHTEAMKGDFNYGLTVTVFFSGNNIQVTTHAKSWLRLWSGGYHGGQLAEVRGNVVEYTNTVVYQISVSEDGGLVVQAGTPSFADNSQHLNVSGWDNFIIGNIVDAMKGIQQLLKPVVQNSMNKFSSEITSSLNGYRGWIFPGGKTFAFKQAAFSNYQDLVSDITYV